MQHKRKIATWIMLSLLLVAITLAQETEEEGFDPDDPTTWNAETLKDVDFTDITREQLAGAPVEALESVRVEQAKQYFQNKIPLSNPHENELLLYQKLHNHIDAESLLGVSGITLEEDALSSTSGRVDFGQHTLPIRFEDGMLKVGEMYLLEGELVVRSDTQLTFHGGSKFLLPEAGEFSVTETTDFFSDSEQHADAVGSFIQSDLENKRLIIRAKEENQIQVTLHTNEEGEPDHPYTFIQVDAREGIVDIREGTTRTVVDHGVVDVQGAPQTPILTSSGYVTSMFGSGVCSTPRDTVGYAAATPSELSNCRLTLVQWLNLLDDANWELFDAERVLGIVRKVFKAETGVEIEMGPHSEGERRIIRIGEEEVAYAEGEELRPGQQMIAIKKVLEVMQEYPPGFFEHIGLQRIRLLRGLRSMGRFAGGFQTDGEVYLHLYAFADSPRDLFHHELFHMVDTNVPQGTYYIGESLPIDEPSEGKGKFLAWNKFRDESRPKSMIVHYPGGYPPIGFDRVVVQYYDEQGAWHGEELDAVHLQDFAEKGYTVVDLTEGAFKRKESLNGEVWDETNPAGKEAYSGGLETGVVGLVKQAKYFIPAKGFASGYGKATSFEDRAEVARRLMMDYEGIMLEAKKNEVLRKKIEIVKRMYYLASDGSMNKMFWKLRNPDWYYKWQWMGQEEGVEA